MNKRMFLKLSAAILGGSSGSRLLGGAAGEPASDDTLTNWAGNYQYSTATCILSRQLNRFASSSRSTIR